MNQIQLVKDENPETPTINQRMQESRPQKVVTDRMPSSNKKWTECKVLGNSISIRSYSAGCTFDDKLYIYGGYQILNGIMNDFYSISLDRKLNQYSWVRIDKKGQYPGPRARHALLAGKSKLYLFGGLASDVKSNNQLYEYNPQTQEWKKLLSVGQVLPCMDSFGSTLLINGDQQRIIIFGGYNEDKYEFSNMVYEYNIQQNKWSVLHEGSPAGSNSKDVPARRSGCAVCADSDSLYIFGGKNQTGKLNDFWELSLKSYKFLELHDQSDNPISRNGHTLDVHDGIIYLFGGIHDITWQLDDLHMFNIIKKRWTVIQHDSPRKVQSKNSTLNHMNNESSPTEKGLNKKKAWYETSPSIYNRRLNAESPTNKASMTNYMNTEENHSPGKMIDEQRRKAFMNKKAEMLRNFEVPDSEKGKLISMETTSQAMRNTLDVIGNPNPGGKVIEGRLTNFGKTSVSTFLKPLSNNCKDILGKRPCARDGHVTIVAGNEIIIFGGDRHQMSFNDVYRLDLGQI